MVQWHYMCSMTHKSRAPYEPGQGFVKSISQQKHPIAALACHQGSVLHLNALGAVPVVVIPLDNQLTASRCDGLIPQLPECRALALVVNGSNYPHTCG